MEYEHRLLIKDDGVYADVLRSNRFSNSIHELLKMLDMVERSNRMGFAGRAR